MARKTVLKPLYLNPQSWARVKSIRGHGRGYESKEDFVRMCNKASESLASLVLQERVRDGEVRNIQHIIDEYKSLVTGLMVEPKQDTEEETEETELEE